MSTKLFFLLLKNNLKLDYIQQFYEKKKLTKGDTKTEKR